MALQVEQLEWTAEHHGDEVAYACVDTGDVLTFAEWESQASSLARGLDSMGTKPGDRVAIHVDSPHVLAWIVAYAAIHKAGAVAVPTNTRLSAGELATVLGHAEPIVLFTSTALRPVFDEAAARVPSVQRVVEVDTGAFGDAMAADDSTFRSSVTEDDLADIMYTSGTTGLPKGIAVRHRQLHILPNGEPEWTGDTWIHGSPLFTFAGISFVYNPMKMGMSCRYLARFDTDRWFDDVEAHRPTMAFLVPATAQLISTSERFESADLSSLQAVPIGSAPLAPSLHRRMADRLPDALVSNNYSMTEAGTAFAYLPREELDRRAGSVGIPMGLEIRIADAEGNPLPAGEVGEVLIHVGTDHREYFRDREATLRTWSGEWLHSGDLGRLDEDGYLYITGRAKDVIIRGGNNIHAADVEAVIYQHPGVLEAAVAAVPHDILGEDVGAWVVPRAGADLHANDVIEHCRTHLGADKCPRVVTFVEELPRNATGKVLKRDLPPAVAPTTT